MKSTLTQKHNVVNSTPSKYRWWDILDEIPDGWSIDKTAGSPAPYTVFITNGKSPLKGQKRALLRVSTKPKDQTALKPMKAKKTLQKLKATQPNPKVTVSNQIPGLFDKPVKAKKKPGCKSAKPEKVYAYSEEIRLIRKFLALDGKPLTQRHAELLHQEISQAIAEKRVRKTGRYAALIKLVAEKVATVYQRMVSDNIKRLDNLTIKDRAAMEKMCEVSGGVEKRYAVQMINRYAKLQGKNPKAAQVELLLNLIKAGRKAGKLSKSDKDTAQVNKIEQILLTWKKSKGVLPVYSGKLSGLGCPGEECGCSKAELNGISDNTLADAINLIKRFNSRSGKTIDAEQATVLRKEAFLLIKKLPNPKQDANSENDFEDLLITLFQITKQTKASLTDSSYVLQKIAWHDGRLAGVKKKPRPSGKRKKV